MTHHPTVSVAIATYNRASMVRQAVEAALAQTRPPLEVCVSDDASTDATWPALSDLAARDPRVRVTRLERNSGGVENWNHAIRQTSGRYIAWCSDDDRFLPEHLAQSVAYLEAHPETGFVHSGFVDAIETDRSSELAERPLRFTTDTPVDRHTLLPYLLRYYDWPFHPSTIVMRREVWETAGPFDPQYALADTDWFVRAVERFPSAMLACRGAINRRHPGNWSNRVGSAKMQREIFEIVEGAIGRIYADWPLHRRAWKWVWRANVRLRLLLTLRARVRSGHSEAARAAWVQMVEGTGLPLPRLLRRAGDALVRRWSGNRDPRFRDARQSVSPL